jgi:hypothetical protein
MQECVRLGVQGLPKSTFFFFGWLTMIEFNVWSTIGEEKMVWFS